ncbi:MAG: N-acetyl-gamma-glutamyl-phosphate reductase [Anaerolineae bacterium]
MVKIGILGAAGYTGYELVSIFARHPAVEVVFATSGSNAGQCLSDIYPCPYDTPLCDPAEAPLGDVDVAFLCTPHGASATLAAQVLAAGARCIDLSADFRLRDLSVYEKWYQPHTAPELLPHAVYGLTELYRDQVAGATLVANPGCYPTGPILALAPLLRAGAVQGNRIIIDAASGVSGAGVKPTPTVHFVNVHDNYSVYKPGHTHRHVPEIEQELSAAAGQPWRIVFTPHLLPVSRGILSTIYVSLDPAWDQARILETWNAAYGDERFINLLPAGQLATLAHVVNTNRCAISVASAGAPGEWIVVTAIDNLVKGASGQAVQNMNVMLGLDEGLGLIA